MLLSMHTLYQVLVTLACLTLACIVEQSVALACHLTCLFDMCDLHVCLYMSPWHVLLRTCPDYVNSYVSLLYVSLTCLSQFVSLTCPRTCLSDMSLLQISLTCFSYMSLSHVSLICLSYTCQFKTFQIEWANARVPPTPLWSPNKTVWLGIEG